MKKLREGCKIPHQTVVKLPSMYRFSLLLVILSLAFLLTACPGDVNPPCTGDDCPQPCENVATAVLRSIQPSGAFEGETTFQDCYAQGASTSATFTIQPTTKADLNAPRAAVVFDIVDRDVATFPSVTLDVIDRNYKVTPDIFSEPQLMSNVSDGLSATIDFKIKNNATRGNFSLVISTFRLQTGQQPDDVTNDPGALVGRAAYWFSVE